MSSRVPMLSFHTYAHLRIFHVWNVNNCQMLRHGVLWVQIGDVCAEIWVGGIHVQLLTFWPKAEANSSKIKTILCKLFFLWRCTIFVESNDTSCGKNGALLCPPAGYREQSTSVHNIHKCPYYGQEQVGRIYTFHVTRCSTPPHSVLALPEMQLSWCLCSW